MGESFIYSKGVQHIAGGVTSGGYFYYYCLACDSRIRVRFLGHETGVPLFEGVCKCGEIHTFRSIIGDIPRKDYVRDAGAVGGGKPPMKSTAKPDIGGEQKAKGDGIP